MSVLPLMELLTCCHHPAPIIISKLFRTSMHFRARSDDTRRYCYRCSSTADQPSDHQICCDAGLGGGGWPYL